MLFFFHSYPYACCKLRHVVIPYMYSEMKNKLSKTGESPLESMGQIISSLNHDFVSTLSKLSM